MIFDTILFYDFLSYQKFKYFFIKISLFIYKKKE